jgi:hypothetical protein
MEIIQSFWSKPFQKNINVTTSDRASGGWENAFKILFEIE